MNWIDVHTHFNMLEASPRESLKQAIENGVDKMITIGTCEKDLPIVLNIAEELSPHVYCALGVHPHDAKDYNSSVEEFILNNLNHKRVVALGEMGLDYYYNNSDPETQKKVFKRQLEMAVEHDLPVEIHTRDAEEDTVEIIGSFGGKVRGLLHCFTGSRQLAEKAIELGLNISLSGVLTFKNAEDLREIAKVLPFDRIHVETDAPFLAPVPHRGKKNTPAYVSFVGEKLAELRGVTDQEVKEQTYKNAHNLFTKM